MAFNNSTTIVNPTATPIPLTIVLISSGPHRNFSYEVCGRGKWNAICCLKTNKRHTLSTWSEWFQNTLDSFPYKHLSLKNIQCFLNSEWCDVLVWWMLIRKCQGGKEHTTLETEWDSSMLKKLCMPNGIFCLFHLNSRTWYSSQCLLKCQQIPMELLFKESLHNLMHIHLEESSPEGSRPIS